MNFALSSLDNQVVNTHWCYCTNKNPIDVVVNVSDHHDACRKFDCRLGNVHSVFDSFRSDEIRSKFTCVSR